MKTLSLIVTFIELMILSGCSINLSMFEFSGERVSFGHEYKDTFYVRYKLKEF